MKMPSLADKLYSSAIEDNLKSHYQSARLRAISDIETKYSSVEGLETSKKVEFLKQKSTNPLLFASKDPDTGISTKNPYDGISSAYAHWTQLGPQAMQKYDAGKQAEFAGKYYDHVLKPLYGALGAAPISREKWLKVAYDKHGALAYHIEDAYHFGKSVHAGIAAVEAQLGNMGRIAFTAMDKMRPDTANNMLMYKMTGAATDPDNSSLLQSRRQSVEAKIAGWFERGSNNFEFFDSAMPNKSWFGKSVQATTELVASAPLFKGMGAANEAVLLKGLENAPGLSRVLAASKGGQLVAKSLMAGSENTLYGAVTRDKDDVHPLWQDFAWGVAANAAFSIGGKATGKLWDIASNPATRRMQQRAEATAENIGKGKGTRTAGETIEGSIVHDAAVTSAGTVAANHAMHEEAIQLLLKLEKLSGTERRVARESFAHEDGPEATAAILTSMDKIDAILQHQPYNSKSLDEVLQDPELLKSLNRQLGYTIADGAEQQAEHSPIAQAANEAEGGPQAVKNSKLASKKVRESANPVEKARRISAIRQQRDQGELKLTQIPELKGSKPRYGYGSKLFELEFADPRDKAAYILANANKSSAHDVIHKWYHAQTNPDNVSLHGGRVRAAIKELAKNADPKDGPLKIPSQRVERTAPNPASMTLKTRTSGSAGSKAGRTVSVTPDWNVYLDKRVKPAYEAAKKRGEVTGGLNEFLKTWFEGMSEKEFADDLHENFMPKALRDAGIFFEPEHEAPLGKVNVNLYGFMWNYKDMLPKPLQEELGNRLVESLKVQRGAEQVFGKKPVPDSFLDHFALGTYNHMDNLIAHGPFLEEQRNVFRSSMQDALHPTKWMKMSIRDRVQSEQKLIVDMFAKHPEQQKTALLALKKLQTVLVGHAKDGNMDAFRDSSEEIAQFFQSEAKKSGSRFNISRFKINPKVDSAADIWPPPKGQ